MTGTHTQDADDHPDNFHKLWVTCEGCKARVRRDLAHVCGGRG